MFLVIIMSETIYCDCGECTECDERAFDKYIEQQTDDQINHMHGVDD